MERNMRICLAALALLAAPVAAQEEGQEPGRAVSFTLGAGAEYDSTVAVLELDTNANAGDRAALLEVGVGYDKPSPGRFDLQAGYNFSQSLHADFDEFDVRIQRGSATTSWDFGRLDVGANVQLVHAALDGAEFLTMEQISPYVSQLFGRRLFLRFAFTHSAKDFAQNPGRTADANQLSTDAYVFLNGLTTYLVLGYRYDEEDARDAQFDYDGGRLRAQLSRRIEAGARELTLRTSVQVEARDYERPTPVIGELRRDDRRQFEATLDVPLRDRLIAQLAFKYADNESNLPSVDFAERVLAVTFNATF